MLVPCYQHNWYFASIVTLADLIILSRGRFIVALIEFGPIFLLILTPTRMCMFLALLLFLNLLRLVLLFYLNGRCLTLIALRFHIYDHEN
jgi:hypothetical protein